jgi:predicted transcriptional regulator
MTTLVLNIPDALARRLGRLARQDGTPVNALAVEAIETFVQNMEPFRRAAQKGMKHESAESRWRMNSWEIIKKLIVKREGKNTVGRNMEVGLAARDAIIT